MKQALRGDECQIGKSQCQRGLGQPIVADPRNDPQQEFAGKKADHSAAEKRHGKILQSADRVRIVPAQNDREQDNEQRNRRGVVEERFALDQPRQPRRCADLAEDGDHGRRIGRGDDGAEQQTDHQRYLRERPQRQADHGRGDKRGDDGEKQDRGRVLDRAPDVCGDPGLEDEEGQKHVDEGCRTDRQIGKQPGGKVDRARQAQLAHDHRQGADRHADRREQNRRRQFEPNGERLAYPDHDQQARDDEQHKGSIKHRVTMACDRIEIRTKRILESRGRSSQKIRNDLTLYRPRRRLARERETGA